MSIKARIGIELGNLRLDLSISANDGERIALLGPNGTGKTTALRVLAGLLPVTHGEVKINGTVVNDGSYFMPAEKRGIGYCPQDLLLFPNMTAVENVAFGLRARGVSRTTATAAAREMLARLGGESYAESRPDQLSVGQKQRVALARALTTGSKLLLLDEPTSAIDAASRPGMHEVINDVARETGATVVVVTHDRDEASALADRTIEMS